MERVSGKELPTGINPAHDRTVRGNILVCFDGDDRSCPYCFGPETD